MYSDANYDQVDARIDDLHRAVRPVASSYTSGTIRRWTATLAGLLKPATQSVPVERHAH